jgi:hypothetical protein
LLTARASTAGNFFLASLFDARFIHLSNSNWLAATQQQIDTLCGCGPVS